LNDVPTTSSGFSREGEAPQPTAAQHDRAPPGVMTKTIGLCMIVKNEAAIVLRCLESVRPLVDFVLVEDTGSTDGTQDLIRQYLDREHLPGEVFDEPWRDFAHNRSVALARLRQRADIDYALIMDADDVLVVDEGFDPAAFKAALGADIYDVSINEQGVWHFRPQICGNRLEFYFRGVLHEFLQEPPGEHSRAPAAGIHILSRREGARSRDPDKYRKDAFVLSEALAAETDTFLRARYTFYLAQSWRDCGENEKALAAYLDRAELGFWDEEVFISLYHAARLKEALGHPGAEVIGTFLRAADACPRRAEAAHGAARLCRTTDDHEQGYRIAKQALDIPLPANGLFVEPWIYDYGLLDELSVSAYWSGHYRESLDACERLLSEGKMPEDMRERVEMNARFAREKMAASIAASNDGEPVQAVPEELIEPAAAGRPKVLLAILAKQKEAVLPLYLKCIEALDYPKSSIVLHVRTNNNTDRTAEILRDWVSRVGDRYAHVVFDDSDIAERVQDFGVHEWNAVRFKALARLRQESLAAALQFGCDFYFVVDVDNFILPDTLASLISLNLPIVAPLLKHVDPASSYSNFHETVDQNGYFVESDYYHWILTQKLKGLWSVPTVHCTYLVRGDVIPQLSYDDGSGRYEYVIFSDVARKKQIDQFIDNRSVYGYLTLDESAAAATRLVGPAVGTRLLATKTSDVPEIFFACGLPSSGSTWLFNLIREICDAAGRPFKSLYADAAVNVPWDELGSELIIVKSHAPFEGLRSVIAQVDEPAVITIRDPRDAVVSFMNRFGVSFDECLKGVAAAAKNLTELSKLRDLPILRYEDGFVGMHGTFDLIARLLRAGSLADRRDTILASLSPDAVRAKIEEFRTRGILDNAHRADPDTQWHSGHVSDRKVGKFKRALTPKQQRIVVDRTAEFCEHFAYAVDVGRNDTCLTDKPLLEPAK
jgi:glycosyltransferase involved in cell wall biosynthesis